MEWLGLMPEMVDAVAVVYVCMTFLFSSLFIISYLNVQHYRLHFKSSVCQLVGHTYFGKPFSLPSGSHVFPVSDCLGRFVRCCFSPLYRSGSSIFIVYDVP